MSYAFHLGEVAGGCVDCAGYSQEPTLIAESTQRGPRADAGVDP